MRSCRSPTVSGCQSYRGIAASGIPFHTQVHDAVLADRAEAEPLVEGDRTVLALEAEGVELRLPASTSVYAVPLGEEARRVLFAKVTELRKLGVAADFAYGGRGLKGAMESANRSGARDPPPLPASHPPPSRGIPRPLPQTPPGPSPPGRGPLSARHCSMPSRPVCRARLARARRSAISARTVASSDGRT